MILEDILKELQSIRKLLETRLPVQSSALTDLVIELPAHLQTTLLALIKTENQKATAQEISDLTKRQRAVESGYLNQLVTMNLVEKHREGRKAYFSLISP